MAVVSVNQTCSERGQQGLIDSPAAAAAFRSSLSQEKIQILSVRVSKNKSLCVCVHAHASASQSSVCRLVALTPVAALADKQLHQLV